MLKRANNFFCTCFVTSSQSQKQNKLPIHKERLNNLEKAEIYAEIIKNSILCSFAKHSNSFLQTPDYQSFDTSLSNKKINNDTIKVAPMKNTEVLQYFLLAENIPYGHLRFLEYYHVLEYHFLKNLKEKIALKSKELYSEMVTSLQEKNEDYFWDKFRFVFEASKKEQNEEAQIQAVVRDFIGYTVISNTIGLIDIKGLGTKSILDIPDIPIQNVVDRSKKDNKEVVYLKSASYVKQEDQIAFCEALARRIYKIRNQIVHTKQGERELFVPTKSNLEAIKLDLDIIRELAYILICRY